ncbi:Os01g0302100 [Oryza sativa Japonica Group]|uniref:Os01g0302100 protein n=2 Tax=Oryza sativa subsp. japonica TaxID=39947 RepID=Q0JND8_ORYSJ|nr:P0035H10.6 [Oryza sativa Japonica Group]BAF04740.1 Os01g0302100 [Oryza sativa Japonica Group]|eukprot:NP_001042826.1 Os01g0302100 [Oryza sativa Japonica Group]
MVSQNESPTPLPCRRRSSFPAGTPVPLSHGFDLHRHRRASTPGISFLYVAPWSSTATG